MVEEEGGFAKKDERGRVKMARVMVAQVTVDSWKL